jgi:hypothetical protein
MRFNMRSKELQGLSKNTWGGLILIVPDLYHFQNLYLGGCDVEQRTY